MTETDTSTTETFTYRVNQDIILSDSVREILLNGSQIADMLEISPATWRGWVSKKLAPPADGKYSRLPMWKWKTIVKYLKDAPGGRLGYPVG